jgi:hypothetical protein
MVLVQTQTAFPLGLSKILEAEVGKLWRGWVLWGY